MPVYAFNGDGNRGDRGSDGNDTITSTANGTGQVHLWGNGGDDWINLDFAPQGVDNYDDSRHLWWKAGYHVYGGRNSGSEGIAVVKEVTFSISQTC